MGKEVLRATVRDVASLCDVSIATVSRVLSETGKVSPEVSARVAAAVAKLGYRYVKRERANPARDTKIIIVADNIANPFYMEIIQSALNALESRSYKVLIAQTSGATSMENVLRFADKDGFSGVILITAVETRDLLDLLKNVTFHLVLVNRVIRSLDLNSVCLDNFTGGYRAAQYLMDKGHKNIAHLSGPTDSTASSDRHRGYTMALRDAGIEPVEKAICKGDLTKESGRTFAEYFVKHLGGYTAVFCANDLMALAFIDEMRCRGFKIPADVSVVGFDDIPLAETYRLTSFASDGDKMGKVAAEVMANILGNGEDGVRKIVFPPTLKERESVLDLRIERPV